MDKLEPILKQHFWILLVPLLSMNLWGYFSANSELSTATTTRQGQLDSAKSSIVSGATEPNEKYKAGLEKENGVLEKYVKEELDLLWERQQARMTWPKLVAADIPKKYKADIPDGNVRFSYQTIYLQDVIKPLHDSVEPMTLNTKDLTYVPKVDFPITLIPQMKVGNFTITSAQMWDAQEDVWVTQLLLDAIRQMNKDADSTSSAVIRRVISYRLLGGDGTPVAMGAAAGGGSSGGEDSMMMMGPGYNGGGGSSGGATGGSSKVQTSVKFDPAEEFGAGGEPASNTGMGGGGMSSMMLMTSGEDGGSTGDAAAAGSEILRYVKLEEGAPYVERGFYLSVIINQNKLVDFLVALSNSDWPIKVVRFQIGKNPWRTDEFKSTAVASNGPMGMAGQLGSMGMGPPSDYNPTAAFEGSTGMGSMGMGPGGLPGGVGGAGAVNTGYKITDLDHPDLIQLDLAGLVTIFNQPEAETPEEGAANDGSAPKENSEGAPAGDTPPAAANPETPMPDGSGEPAPAAPETAPASDAAPAEPAAAPDPAAGTPTPAAETPEPAAPEPAAPTSSEPAATESAPANP